LCYYCETHFISPSPSENALNNFYESYYVKHAKILANKWYCKRKISVYDIYEDVRISVLGTLLNINASEVLDVGCGSGEFLLNLKYLGAQVTGIDLSQEAINEAHKSGLKRLFKVPFSEFACETKYDLIVLNDIIEHPLEPLKLIAKANSLLKIGGLLLIWTPNNDNIFLDPEIKTLRVDLEHMQYLGSKACKHLSENYQLNIVHYESLGYCSYSPNSKKSYVKKLLILFFKKLYLYSSIKNIYSLFKFKRDRRGSYHLFVIFKKTS
jgi:2-polyprenyl-3-methyl-5-hydroxy-6-metoxy-1,4-benzoquinol methylase